MLRDVARVVGARGNATVAGASGEDREPDLMLNGEEETTTTVMSKEDPDDVPRLASGNPPPIQEYDMDRVGLEEAWKRRR